MPVIEFWSGSEEERWKWKRERLERLRAAQQHLAHEPQPPLPDHPIVTPFSKPCDTPRPAFLYKHTRRAYAEALSQRGSIRLGSLGAYRQAEALAAGVGDSGEGTIHERTHIDFVGGTNVPLPDHPLLFSRATRAHIKNTNGLTMRNVRIEVDHSAPNRFLMWCLSTDASAEVGRALDPEYDCVVEVPFCLDTIRVLEIGVRAALPGSRAWDDAQCTYQDREHSNPTPEQKSQMLLLKPARFAPQREYRIVFATPGEAPPALVVTVPELIGCRIIDYGTASQ